MALKNVGLGAVLTFTGGAAIAGMTRAAAAAKTMGASFLKAKAAAATLARGLKTLAIAGVGVTAVLGLMVNKAANFEQQMANVRAVAVRATTEEMAAMTQQAKELGATTQFTAVQAAEGMELLTRAGFNAQEVMSALPSVLNAAAAEGMDLATAADLVAKSIRIMGLEASDAERVADVLASTSALANTNMQMLGEAFKFGGSQASMLNLSIEETAAVFGKLADAGLQGSLGGTSFTNMLIKMTKPSKAATKFMEQNKIALTEVGKNGEKVFRKMPDLVDDYSAALNKIEDPAERAAMATEIFGIRGAKAFAALEKAGGDSLRELTQQLEDSQGAARRMAETRLDTFKGQITLLGSAIEGFSIEIGSIFLPVLTKGLKVASRFVGDLAVGLGILLNPAKANTEEAKKQAERWGKLGSIAQQVVTGMVAGINILRQQWESLRGLFSKVGDILGDKIGEGTVAKIAKIITVVLGVAAVVGPLVLALGGAWIIVFAAIGVVTGAIGVLTALFWPLVAVVLVFSAAIKVVKRDNESTWGAVMRIVSSVFGFFKKFFTGIFKGLKKAFEPIKKTVEPVWKSLMKTLGKVGKIFKKFFKTTGGDAEDWGETLGTVIGLIARAIVFLISVTVRLASFLIGTFASAISVAISVFNGLKMAVGLVVAIIKKLVGWLADKLAPAWNAIKDAAKGAFDAMTGVAATVLEPLKKIAVFLKDKLVAAWETAMTAIGKAIKKMSGPVGRVLGDLRAIVKALTLLDKFGISPGSLISGQAGPLPVSPGPTPATTAAAPQISPSITVAGGGGGDIVIHSHLILDGREVAQSVETFKMDRKTRSTEVTPGELREFAQVTAA
jgi:TP901 family phage tail tape measure protein